MDRRTFNLSLAKTAAAVVLAPRFTLNAFAADQSSIDSLYAGAMVIDSLCAPLWDIEAAPSTKMLAAIRGSGVTAINFTLSTFDFNETVFNLGNVEKLEDDHPNSFLIVRHYSDLIRAKKENKLGIMLGFQNIEFLEEDPERIQTFRKLGVRIMQLTYNKRGKFGDGCMEPANAGLTRAGIDAMKMMNDWGVAVDLSHSGYRATSDGIAQSAKPVLISHSGCAAVYPHPRNQPDENLKALADHGGYFGVYLMPYLVASPTVPTREHVLDHLEHAINVCGADHVGIGSDGQLLKAALTPEMQSVFQRNMELRKQRGVATPGEDRYPYVPDLNSPDYMHVIAAELAKRGKPAATIEKVLGSNFQRVIGEIWGTT